MCARFIKARNVSLLKYIDFFLQYFSASCDDLTRYFPNGVASIIVEQDSAPWQVFTEVGYEGNPKYLYPGNYDDLNELGLEKPVKSFRTAPVSLSLITYLIRTVSLASTTTSRSCIARLRLPGKRKVNNYLSENAILPGGAAIHESAKNSGTSEI